MWLTNFKKMLLWFTVRYRDQCVLLILGIGTYNWRKGLLYVSALLYATPYK